MEVKRETSKEPDAMQLKEDQFEMGIVPSIPGRIVRKAHKANRPTAVLSVIMAVVTCVLALLQTVLDVFRVSTDPVLQDGFRLALGGLLASIAADRFMAASAAKELDE